MIERSSEIPRGLRAAILVARIVGTLFAVFLIAMMVGYAVNPQGKSDSGLPDEWLRMLFFPVGLCVGYLISWRWVLLGGVISIGCAAVFLIIEGQADLLGIIGLLCVPAVILFVCGLLAWRYNLGAASG
jgi:hypothetical protein